MIKFTADFEWFDKKAIALQCEQISQLIIQGHTEGDGWKIEGEEEKEPHIEGGLEEPLLGEQYN